MFCRLYYGEEIVSRAARYITLENDDDKTKI